MLSAFRVVIKIMRLVFLVYAIEIFVRFGSAMYFKTEWCDNLRLIVSHHERFILKPCMVNPNLFAHAWLHGCTKESESHEGSSQVDLLPC